MHAGPFDEEAMFRAIADSGVRALLIGRRAMVALGLPVLTADYDFWVHVDDIEAFNEALESMDVHPNRSPQQARQRGRYVLENDERIDVMVARQLRRRTGPSCASTRPGLAPARSPTRRGWTSSCRASMISA